MVELLASQIANGNIICRCCKFYRVLRIYKWGICSKDQHKEEAWLNKYGEKYRYVVYTGDVDVTPQEILQKAKDCFDIEVVDTNLQFIYLRTRFWLESNNYPYLTLLLQNLASFLLESRHCFDTIHMFSLIQWAIRLLYLYSGGSPAALLLAMFIIPLFPALIYYRIFATLYSFSGICSEVVMVNGTWTRNHIVALWDADDRTYLVYPPCNVDNLLRINSKAEKLLTEEKRVQILSIGQIRPEKDHRLQICFLAELKKRLLKENLSYEVRLVICGGCRDMEDVQRAKDLQLYAEDMGLSTDDLEWAINAPVDKVAALLEESLIGIHTMQNEHFGISVVEGIAAGQIMVAHNSGGPKLDILNANAVGSKTPLGLLATSVHDFVDSVLEIIRMSSEERSSMRDAARCSVNRFTEANFEKRWNSEINFRLASIGGKSKHQILGRKDSVNEDVRRIKQLRTHFFQRSSVQVGFSVADLFALSNAAFAEFMIFTGKLLVERSALSSRSSVKENEYFCHTFIRQDGLSGICITDAEYQQRIAFTMLRQVLDDFAANVPPFQWKAMENNCFNALSTPVLKAMLSQAQIKTEKDCTYTGLPELLMKWQNPRKADAMTRVQEEVEETKIVLHNTIQSVLERGEKLDDLIAASEGLSNQSKLFYTQARKMNKCCSWA
ncbi:Synaptobrevin YKT6 [Dirofilaria immitis]|nr:Synaptobrevin YKT6 [Dirofilaria immitis]